MTNLYKTFLATTLIGISTSFSSEEEVLTKFDSSNDKISNWQIVDDGVMGGLSKGKFKISDKNYLIFNGNLSLKNNGGFSSIRSQRTKMDLSNHKGIKIRVKGDGRSYKMRFESDSKYRSRSVSFQHEFETTSGEWSEIFIPFENLKASFRGWNLPKMKFNPKSIQRFGLIIADKKEGPFKITVDWIKAV